MHWRRKWHPTPVFLPGEHQGWRGLVGCRLWGRTESDTTELTAAAVLHYFLHNKSHSLYLTPCDLELRDISNFTAGSLSVPCGSGSKESACQCRRCRRCRFDPWVRKISWRGKWQSAPVFLPRKFHEERILEGYSPRGCEELDMTEHTHAHHVQVQRAAPFPYVCSMLSHLSVFALVVHSA